MTKKSTPETVKVIARSNVLNLQWGDQAEVPATSYVEMLINAGRLELVEEFPPAQPVNDNLNPPPVDSYDGPTNPGPFPVLVPIADAVVAKDEPKPLRARRRPAAAPKDE